VPHRIRHAGVDLYA